MPKQILGAAILGVGGDEVIHVLLDTMYMKAPYTVIQRAMHIHPTVAEYLPTLLGKLEPFAWFATYRHEEANLKFHCSFLSEPLRSRKLWSR